MDLLLYITDKCNLNCTYCLGQKGIYKNKHTISEQNLAKLVELIDKDRKFINSINFDSGEPLLAWPEIKYLVSELDKIDFKPNYTLLTNGILLTTDKIKFLKDHDFNVRLSFQAPQKSFLKNKTGNSPEKLKEYYVQVMDNIKACLKAGLVLKINFVITPDLIEGLPEGLDHLFKNNIYNIALIPVLGYFWTKQDIATLDQYLPKISKLILKYISRNNYRSFLAHIEQTIIDIKLQIDPKKRKEMFCINYDGNIYTDEDFLLDDRPPLHSIGALQSFSSLKNGLKNKKQDFIFSKNKQINKSNLEAYNNILSFWKDSLALLQQN